MALDVASTVATIIALFVAAFALLITSAQAVQQYMNTNQLLRMCDEIVFSGAPGGGHRKWVMRQFRFRIVYQMPCLTLKHFWSLSQDEEELHFERTTSDFPDLRYDLSQESINARNLLSLLFRRRQRYAFYRPISYKTGEASWVSFIRSAQRVIEPGEIRFQIVEGDADRCPPDLPAIPMPISLRDVLLIAFSLGLKVTGNVSKKEDIAMSGALGTLTSSHHPVLGTLIHFVPNDSANHTELRWNSISHQWTCRLFGNNSVANTLFFKSERHRIERMEGIWKKDLWRADTQAKFDYGPAGTQLMRKSAKDMVDYARWRKHEHGGKVTARDVVDSLPNTRSGNTRASDQVNSGRDLHSSTIHKSPNDGDWHFIAKPIRRSNSRGSYDEICVRPRRRKLGTLREKKHLRVISRLRRRFNDKFGEPQVWTYSTSEEEKTPNLPPEDSAAADERSDPVSGIEDVATNEGPRVEVPNVEDSREQVAAGPNGRTSEGCEPSVVGGTTYQAPFIEEAGDIEPRSRSSESSEEKEPTRRMLALTMGQQDSTENLAISAQAKRDEERAKRNKAFRKRQRNRGVTIADDICWLWACQSNIMPGYWATPWENFYGKTSIGAITVILECLSAFTEADLSLVFVDRDTSAMRTRCLNWYRLGKMTFPGYALNARSGVVVGGSYVSVNFKDFHVELPPIELFGNYADQTKDRRGDSALDTIWATVELMNLDSWLSMACRTKEISNGRCDLLHATPHLVHHVMCSFEDDFQDVELTAVEGGFQLISEISANINDLLSDEGLSRAEQLFVLVAMMRAAKYALCVARGPSTKRVEDFLDADLQVNMV